MYFKTALTLLYFPLFKEIKHAIRCMIPPLMLSGWMLAATDVSAASLDIPYCGDVHVNYDDAFPFGNINVFGTAPTGTVLARSTINLSVSSKNSPSATYVDYYYFGSSQGVINNQNTYKTNIPGIVFFIENYNTAVNHPYPSFNFGLSGEKKLYFVFIKSDAIPVGNYRLDFTHGSINVACVGRGGGKPLKATSGMINVTTPPCKVLNSDIQVPMGSPSVNQFKTAGSVVNPRPFAIPLSCESSADISFSVSPSASGSPDPDKGIISLNSPNDSATAKGVSLQILFQSKPLKLNQVTAAGKAGIQRFDIPLQAQYIQTASQVTAGNANATAAFVINYN